MTWMRLDIVKCHGSGNDFPLVDARALSIDDADWGGIARALANRAGPVGGDGLLALVPGRNGAAFGMRMWNADGSEAETCLNGLRCVARAGFAALGGTTATVSLATSTAEASLDDALAPGVNTIRETAGPAQHDARAWLLVAEVAEHVERPLAPLPGFAWTALAIPNPHLIAFVDRIDEAALVAAGTLCESAPGWLPTRANVSFVEARSRTTLFVRTFERGVGLTDSCGSAMAASTHAAALTGRIDHDVAITVLNRGGLVRAIPHRDGRVTLSGNATWEWHGSVSVDLATAQARDLAIDRHFPDEIAAWSAVQATARA